MLIYRQKWIDQIEAIRAEPKREGYESVFHGLLRADLPPSEKSTARLRQEAQLLVLAGQDTTGRLIYFELWNTDVG
jgi:cytochrome P450